MRLGCIADDLTGATDLGSNLVAGGRRTVLLVDVPSAPGGVDADAVVVALKTRTVAPSAAVERSVAAADWLRGWGAEQLYFKYCSTFDSTDRGNIGPVIDALLDRLGSDFTVAVPALPGNGRTVYMGHLFVGDRLLSESGMERHPLTPMTDPDLVRVLQRQTARRVALVAHATVRAGAGAIRRRVEALRADGAAVAIVDAVCNDDLRAIGAAVGELPLVTGGSGLALGLADGAVDRTAPLPARTGARAVLAGSCSRATNRQVRHLLERGTPGFAIDPLRLAAGADVAGEALAWSAPRLADGPVLVYSTDAPAGVKAVQAALGAERASALVEDALAAIALALARAGVRQLVIAGGETAGACVRALGLRELQVGAAIDPGAPWCYGAARGAGDAPLHVALKSGNFGADDFFARAFA